MATFLVSNPVAYRVFGKEQGRAADRRQVS
jgi:hypothetical protein